MVEFIDLLIRIAVIGLVMSILFLTGHYLLIRKKNTGLKQNIIKKSVAAKYEPLELIKVNAGDLENFESSLYNSDSTVGLILGARGSGKSALGLKIAENFASKTKKKIFAMGFSREHIPSWVFLIQDTSEITNNSFVLIDEGGVFLSSRDSMKSINKLISKIILLARHKDLSILFITQNSSNIEINTIRQADYLMLKPSSLLQLDFERKKIRDVYTEVNNDFQKLKDKQGIFYLYSDSFKGFVSNKLPSFWSKGVSKTLSN